MSLIRAITPDTALPSIEPEARPAPVPFAFTGDSRSLVPFNFRPAVLAPVLTFRPYHDVGHDPRFPVELDQSPRGNHSTRPERHFIDLSSTEAQTGRPQHNGPPHSVRIRPEIQYPAPPSPHNWQQPMEHQQLREAPQPQSLHHTQGFTSKPYEQPPSNFPFNPFSPGHPPPPPGYY
jgi:hypothetical protein